MPNQPRDEAQASPVARRRLRQRATQLQRAVAAVHLAVDGLSGIDQLIVLNEVLTERLREAREADTSLSRMAL